jgi:hypothetical protein
MAETAAVIDKATRILRMIAPPLAFEDGAPLPAIKARRA